MTSITDVQSVCGSFFFYRVNDVDECSFELNSFNLNIDKCQKNLGDNNFLWVI